MNHKHQTSDSDQSATEHWNELYDEKDQVWSGRPNSVLVDSLTGHASGTALDVGCGEGGDAVWLAEQGWTVTAIDVSTTALERAQSAAKSRNVDSQIEWKHLDLTAEMPAGEFDLVSAVFLQSRIDFPREEILKSLAKNVALGGLYLVVSHAAFPPWSNTHNHSDEQPELPDLPSAIETLNFLDLSTDQWEILICAEQSRDAIDPDGNPAELFDAVVLVRRIAH